MKASFAKIKKRYCEKLSEQVLWQDHDDLSTPVHGHGIGPRAGADSARTRREGHALVLANAAQAGRAPRQSGNEDHGGRNFIRENHAAARATRRPRSAATRHELSEPKLCPLSKVIKVVEGVLRRNEMSGKRALDVSSFRMGEDSAEYIGSVLLKTRPVTLKLTNCALTDPCMQHIRTALLDLKDENLLEELFLGVNHFSAEGVELLCEWLQYDESLLLLDLQVLSLFLALFVFCLCVLFFFLSACEHVLQ